MTVQWQGLNENLIAKIYPLNKNKTRDTNQGEVHAPIVDGAALEAQFNWQSPFENAGTESKAPAITAMLQSGAIQPLMNSITGGSLDADFGNAEQRNNFGNSVNEVQSYVSDLEGRAGITKLNSTQIFSGMPPLTVSASFLFRAYANPVTEVMQPINQLWKWALPQELAPDGVLANIIREVRRNDSNVKSYLDALLPSKAPQMVGMIYKGKSYPPMVIESITEPLDSPIDKNGNYTSVVLPVTLSTLTAQDKNDWIKVSSGAAY